MQTLAREIHGPGHGAAILLYDPGRSRVVLVRQFRLPAYLKDRRESLIEVCAGRLDGENAETRISKEAEVGESLVMTGKGEIADAKTILLLHYAERASLMRGDDAIGRL